MLLFSVNESKLDCLYCNFISWSLDCQKLNIYSVYYVI